MHYESQIIIGRNTGDACPYNNDFRPIFKQEILKIRNKSFFAKDFVQIKADIVLACGPKRVFNFLRNTQIVFFPWLCAVHSPGYGTWYKFSAVMRRYSSSFLVGSRRFISEMNSSDVSATAATIFNRSR